MYVHVHMCVCTHACVYVYVCVHMRTHSLSHSVTHTLTHSLAHSVIHSVTHSFLPPSSYSNCILWIRNLSHRQMAFEYIIHSMNNAEDTNASLSVSSAEIDYSKRVCAHMKTHTSAQHSIGLTRTHKLHLTHKRVSKNKKGGLPKKLKRGVSKNEKWGYQKGKSTYLLPTIYPLQPDIAYSIPIYVGSK